MFVVVVVVVVVFDSMFLLSFLLQMMKPTYCRFFFFFPVGMFLVTLLVLNTLFGFFPFGVAKIPSANGVCDSIRLIM